MNRFTLGIKELLRAFRQYERHNAGFGEGFHIKLYGSGAGEVIRDTTGEELIFAFNSPDELWSWLQSCPEVRAVLERKSLRKAGKEVKRLKDYVEDENNKVQ